MSKKTLYAKALVETNEAIAEKEDKLMALENSFKEELESLERQRVALEERHAGTSSSNS